MYTFHFKGKKKNVRTITEVHYLHKRGALKIYRVDQCHNLTICEAIKLCILS